ncbi:MAG: UpxY family transcription antiterminator [Nitrospirota bacterium]
MTETQPLWYALYVKSRHEFMTEGELQRKGIDTYLPSAQKLSQWKDRKKLVAFPLFPGYCFVRVAPRPEAFLSVLKTRGAVSLLAAKPGCPTPVPDEEIRSLQLLIGSGERLDIYPHLKEGMRVRVKRGLLKGAEGVLSRKETSYSFVVNVELLGRSIGVAIGADEVEAA